MKPDGQPHLLPQAPPPSPSATQRTLEAGNTDAVPAVESPTGAPVTPEAAAGRAAQLPAPAQKPAPGSALDDLVAALSASAAKRAASADAAAAAAAAEKPAGKPAPVQEEPWKGTPEPETVDPLSYLE